jgi:putative peptidoglycan lipid II flippase
VAVANSVGMVLLGAVLLVMVSRRAGRPALSGVGRATGAALLAGALAAAAGMAVRLPLPATPGAWGAALAGMLSGVVVAVVFVGIVLLFDRRDLRPLFAAVARRLGHGRARGSGGDEE